ncbi:MAG TPA: [protein-PII] uridylyltransferase [Bryobacteraceae bacterium]|jgi:[protein-PII] uridylyltransferase
MEAVTEAAAASRNPFEFFATRTASVDERVGAAAKNSLLPAAGMPVAVAAVGGYGRRELFPYSDIDLLILVEEESHLAGIKLQVSEFIRVLWDAGLKVSQSVRTVAECCRVNEQNTEMHISLLDLRFIAGDRALFDLLAESLPEFYRQHGGRIVRRLSELARQRHAKFNNTIYHLEPNVKEVPGAIRDIHLLNWFGLLLPDKGPVLEAVGEASAARQFLYSVRCFLHVVSARDNNLLTFERQADAARLLPDRAVAPEDWMRTYYQHARPIFQSATRALEFAEARQSSLVRQFRDWRSRLSNADFTVSQNRILLRNPSATLGSPEPVLGLFAFAARHGILLSWDAQRRVRAALPAISTAFAEHPAPYKSWRDLLSQPNVGLALRQMQETGVLSAGLPHWKTIESLVVRDFYHRYTVDEHTLVAIEALDKLMAESADTPSRFQELALEIDDPAVLRLAVLLHDIGKGTRPGDHVRGSLEAAGGIFAAISAPASVQETVRFLIEHHLDLSAVMNGRDLDDPATARYLTSRIATQEDLRKLALLTYADISAVNPTAMTPWRIEQLWRVYSIAEEQLMRELTENRITPATVSAADFPSPGIAGFLDGFPIRYLRTNTHQQIAHHFDLEQKRRREGVAVEITREPGAYLLTVVATDQPGLFASVCGALASYGMNILKAEASSNADGCILDLIRFADPMRTLEMNPDEAGRLQWTVECVVRGAIQVPDLLKSRRPAPRVVGGARIQPSVRFNNDASDTATLIEFVGEDRPGLLFYLASALSSAGCNIELVLVDTEAHRALDVFYVTRNRSKLDDATQNRLRTALERAGGPSQALT